MFVLALRGRSKNAFHCHNEHRVPRLGSPGQYQIDGLRVYTMLTLYDSSQHAWSHLYQIESVGGITGPRVVFVRTKDSRLSSRIDISGAICESEIKAEKAEESSSEGRPFRNRTLLIHYRPLHFILPGAYYSHTCRHISLQRVLSLRCSVR